MTGAPRRAGTTLAELVVALVITGVAGLIGVGLLAAAERRAHADAVNDRGVQTARDVAHVLGPEIAGAESARLRTSGDTALDLAAHVGVSVACVVAGNVLVVPGEQTTVGSPFTVWRVQPEPSDLVLVWDTLAMAWQEATVDSVVSRRDGAGCSTSGPFRSVADSVDRVPVTWLRLGGVLPATIGAGAPVRVYREVRWMLYRSSDRNWWLGFRRCPGGVCGSAQPVAGPLAAPTDSGLVFSIGAHGVIAVTVRPAADVVSSPRPMTRLWSVRGAPE